MRRQHILRVLLLDVCALLVCACSFFNDPSPQSSSTEPSAAAVIGAGGGSLSLTVDGATVISVTVPEGAVSASTAFSITRRSISDESLGHIYELAPTGVEFALPVEVGVDYSAFMASSGLSEDAIGLYYIGDDDYMNPVFNPTKDTATKRFIYRMWHFCGAAAGESYVFISASDMERLRGKTGTQMTPQYLARCAEIDAAYTTANADYFDRTSFAAGFNTVKAWCDARTDLGIGGWTDFQGEYADLIIVDYELIVASDSVDWSVDPMGLCTYIQRVYGNGRKGTILPNFYYFVAMPGEERSTYDATVTPAVNRMEGYDIFVKPTLSKPVFDSLNQADLIYLADGEAHSIEASFTYPYVAHGEDVDYAGEVPDGESGSLPLVGQEISFEIMSGPGALSNATATTDGAGRAQCSFTADWTDEANDGETATVRVALTHGALTLEKTLTITERKVDTDDPIPGNSGKLSCTGTSETLSLSWDKATDGTTASSELCYLVLRSTTNNIDTLANAWGNGSVYKDWTYDVSSALVAASTITTNYYYTVIVKDAGGNEAVYSQLIMPIVYSGSGPATGTYMDSDGYYFSFGSGMGITSNMIEIGYTLSGSYSYDSTNARLTVNMYDSEIPEILSDVTLFFNHGSHMIKKCQRAASGGSLQSISGNYSLAGYVYNYIDKDNNIYTYDNYNFDAYYNADGSYSGYFYTLDEKGSVISQTSHTGTWTDNGDNSMTIAYSTGITDTNKILRVYLSDTLYIFFISMNNPSNYLFSLQ